ncbi:MAG: hypothetical protein WCP29_19125 [Acidobacteriota bacterium]
MAKKASWGLIIFGIAAVAVIVGVGLVAIAGYVIYQQFAIQSTNTSASSAEDEFAQVAARFANQQPLLDIKDGEPVVNTGRRQADRVATPIDALHIMVWQSDERKLVKLNIPFWLLRLTKGRPIKLSGRPGAEDADPVRLNISAEDLERYGPGLVINHKDTSGDRVLVWAK